MALSRLCSRCSPAEQKQTIVAEIFANVAPREDGDSDADHTRARVRAGSRRVAEGPRRGRGGGAEGERSRKGASGTRVPSQSVRGTEIPVRIGGCFETSMVAMRGQRSRGAAFGGTTRRP